MRSNDPPPSHHDEKGSGRLVVQTSLVRVPDDGRNDHTQEQCSNERPPRANPATGKRNDAHAEHNVTDAAADEDEKHHLGECENTESRERVVLEKCHRYENAQAPIKEQRANSAPRPCDGSWTRLRQSQPFARPSLLSRRLSSTRLRVGRWHHPILCEPRNTTETRAIPLRNRFGIFFLRLHNAAGTRTTNRESVHVQ